MGEAKLKLDSRYAKTALVLWGIEFDRLRVRESLLAPHPLEDSVARRPAWEKVWTLTQVIHYRSGTEKIPGVLARVRGLKEALEGNQLLEDVEEVLTVLM